MLVVANQTIGGADLEAAVRERLASDASSRFLLLVPVPPTPPSAIAVGLAAAESASTAVIDLPDPREVARDRLTCGIEWLARLGADASGTVVDGDPVDAVEAAVGERSIDEIIVSTLPSRISRWLRQDLPSRIERRVAVPVSVVTARADDE